MKGETERVSKSENMMSHVSLAQTLQAGYVNTPHSVASWTQQTPHLSNPSACCCATLFLFPHMASHMLPSLPSSFPSLTLLLSLSPGSLRETAAPLSGREEHGKTAQSKINKHILTWNYAHNRFCDGEMEQI